MQAPISVISGPGSTKAVAVVVILLGLFAASAIGRQQTQQPRATAGQR